METTNVTSSPDEFRHVLDRAALLRSRGHRSDDVAAGVPSMAALKTPDDASVWRATSTEIAHYAGSPLLDLVLWCLTKEKINDLAA